jgi:hypothetical protein
VYPEVTDHSSTNVFLKIEIPLTTASSTINPVSTLPVGCPTLS